MDVSPVIVVWVMSLDREDQKVSTSVSSTFESWDTRFWPIGEHGRVVKDGRVDLETQRVE